MTEITFGSTPTKVSNLNQKRTTQMGKVKRKAAPPNKKAQPAVVKSKKSQDAGVGDINDMTEENKAELISSEARKRSLAADDMAITDKKSWSVSEDEFGMFCVIDDADGKVTGKWPSADQANAQIKVLQNEDEAGRATT
jgi:hypothetical protein